MGADIPRYVRKQLADFGDDRKAIRAFGPKWYKDCASV